MIRVLANGCFDPLHYGHLLHLRAASRMGDVLIVALTSDEAVRREKGVFRPLYPWDHRAALLRDLRFVSQVVHSDNFLDVLNIMRPDVLAKGVDYRDTGLTKDVHDLCGKLGIEIRYTDTPKYSASDYVREMMTQLTSTATA